MSGLALADDEWLGRTVFFKPDAKAMNGRKAVDHRQIPFPAVVDNVDGDWLLLGPAWVRKSDVLFAREALEYFTKRIETQPRDVRSYVSRGLVLNTLDRPAEAVRDFTEAMRVDRTYSLAYYNRALARDKLGEFAGADQDYRTFLRYEPRNARGYRAYAFHLVSCRDPGFRDGKRAVELATKACELMDWQEPTYLDTLAAAYSEAKDFRKAIEWQDKAIARMEYYDDPARLEHMRRLLVLYKDHKPYRECLNIE